VVFDSLAVGLVTGDTNGQSDIFMYDQVTGQTTRVSVASNGIQGNGSSYQPSISADGRYIAFTSWSTNLVAEGETNGFDNDIFVHDRVTGETTRVSVASDGTQGNDYSSYPSISADGRHVAFRSNATNLVVGDTNGVVDVFVHDRQTEQTTRVSVDNNGTQGNSFSDGASISADGRYVAFSSPATNLVAGDTNGRQDIFVHKQW
jgi:Tol biopolymer transport system component